MGDYGVVLGVDDEGGDADGGEQVGEGLAVEEGFPGGACGHFAVGVPGDELFGVGGFAVEGVEVGLVVEAAFDVVFVAFEELVADLGVRGLEAHCADEDEGVEAGLVGDGDFGGEEAAEAEADDGAALDGEFVEEELEDGGEVAGAAHPVAAGGAVPAGQGGEEEVVGLGEVVVEGEPAGVAGFVVDDEQAGACAAAAELDGEAGDLDLVFLGGDLGHVGLRGVGWVGGCRAW